METYDVKIERLGNSYRIKEYPVTKIIKDYVKEITRNENKWDNLFNETYIQLHKEEYGYYINNYETCDPVLELEALKYIEFTMEQQKKKNKKDSIRRSRQTVIDLAFCNPQLDYFVTLTFDREIYSSYQLAYEQLYKFIERMKYVYKKNKDKFEYLAVFETTEKGRWHIHMLCNLKLDYMNITCNKFTETYIYKEKKCYKKTNERKLAEQLFQKNYWKQGFTDIMKLIDAQGSAYYLTKYMLKETDDILLEEKCKTRYKCSKGLNRPVTEFISLKDEKNAKKYLDLLDKLNQGNYSLKETYFQDFQLIQTDIRIITEKFYKINAIIE